MHAPPKVPRNAEGAQKRRAAPAVIGENAARPQSRGGAGAKPNGKGVCPASGATADATVGRAQGLCICQVANLEGKAKGRRKSRRRKLRPYERSRCDEHSVPVCPPHRRKTCSHYPRFRATKRGHKVKGRAKGEKSAAQGVIEAGASGPGPGRSGCYSSSMKVISTLTL